MVKKILVLSNNCGGIVCFRTEVFQALRGGGYYVIIAAPQDAMTFAIKDLCDKYIPTPFNRQGKNPFKDIKLIMTYRSIIKKEQPDIVLTYTIKPNLYGGMACRMTKTPQIANVTGLGLATEKPGLLRTITMLLYKTGLKKAHTVFFQNKENKKFCKDHKMVPSSAVLIPGSGVNLAHFNEQPYPDDACIRFIFISRIVYRKGIEDYLEAAKTLKSKYPNVEFHVLGLCEEEKYKEILDRLTKQGVIIYHQPVVDTRPFLTQIHCTVHPSFYPEGMSNVLLESCASGRPVITTDKAGCADVVEEGKNGFIVRQQDVKDLVDKIEKFILLPYEKKKEMGHYARLKMEREFSRDFVIEAYKKAIQDL